MKDKRILWMLIILLLLEIVTPFNAHENVASAATAPTNHLGNKDASFKHFADDEDGWAKQGNGNYLQLGDGNFIRADVNQLRANWHAALAPGVKLGGIALDSPDAYTPPAGYKIHSIASYAVYKMRTYLVQIEKSYCDGGLYTDPKCNPYNFIGDSTMEDNAWAKYPNILTADHWRFYYPIVERPNPGLGMVMKYYQWRTAQIRKSGSNNGAGGTPWLKYDFKIVPDGSTDPGPDPGPGPEGECSVEIAPPSPSGSIQADSFNASATGVIKADHRGNEQFDVLQGIPTSESLYANAFAKEYLFKHIFTNMRGKVIFSVKLKKEYELKWTENNQPKTEKVIVEKDVKVERPYSYWQIDNLEVYGLQYAEMMNYALPGEHVMLNPHGGYSAPNVDASNSDNVKDHVIPPACPKISLEGEVIDGNDKKPTPPTDFQVPDVQSQIGQVKVKNDRVNFNGQQIMSDAEANETAPTPSRIPEAPMTNQDVFYEYGLMISNTKVNKANTPSSGNVYYNQIIGIKGGQGQLIYPILGINTVTVHTPVVMYARASDDKEHDQRTTPPRRSTPANPDTDRHAFILDRPFNVSLPTIGQHRNIPGYGYRDYAKYYRSKQVQFPFDVYSETKQAFYPKNTWINVPINMETANFFLPVWIPEGQYTVRFRAIAENAPNGYTEQHHANLDLQHHAAFDTIEVDVVGRLYDFHVTDILDFRWANVFRTTEGLIEHTGNSYWVGDKGIDGAPRGNKEPFILPIRQGSHPEGYKNVAVKTGYQFKFDMKSKGDMWRENDAIRITPSFYFVDKTGQNRRKVDVYYHNDSKYFVKIGSEQDKEYREVTLNEPLRNVPESQLLNTSDYYFRHPDRYGFRSIVDQSFAPGFDRCFQRDFAKRGVETGPYGWQILSWKLRSLIGPLANTVPSNAMKPQKDAIASEQMWYGEYSLPADVYIVEEGKNIAGYGMQHRLNKSHPIFLRDGYLIVNFNIESIQDGNVDQPHLQYIFGELSNQWKREGFKYNFVDPYGYTFPLIDGDVIFYHGDQSSTDDFKPGVTH